MSTAPVTRCMVTSVRTLAAPMPPTSGFTSDSASTAAATTVHVRRGRAVRRSSRASSARRTGLRTAPQLAVVTVASAWSLRVLLVVALSSRRTAVAASGGELDETTSTPGRLGPLSCWRSRRRRGGLQPVRRCAARLAALGGRRRRRRRCRARAGVAAPARPRGGGARGARGALPRCHPARHVRDALRGAAAAAPRRDRRRADRGGGARGAGRPAADARAGVRLVAGARRRRPRGARGVGRADQGPGRAGGVVAGAGATGRGRAGPAGGRGQDARAHAHRPRDARRARTPPVRWSQRRRERGVPARRVAGAGREGCGRRAGRRAPGARRASRGDRRTARGRQRPGRDTPQSVLADLPALLGETAAAGNEVHLDDRVAASTAMPDTTGRTAYRIVHERAHQRPQTRTR